MKRREFLQSSVGIAGAMLPVLAGAQSKPCPPPAVSVAGSGSVVTACSADGAKDWQVRSAAAGVIWAQVFESADDVNAFRVTNGIGHDPNPAPGSVGSHVRWNPAGGIMGRGCLEMEQLTNGNMNAYWSRPFNPSLVTFKEQNAGGDRYSGQGFYLQLRVKTNCGGKGSVGGGGRKVFSVTRTERTYTWQEIVAQDTYYRGVYQMYQGYGPGGPYASFDVPAGSSDFNFQPNSEFASAPGYCSYQQVGVGNRANCWTWGDNEWITYLMYVLPASDGQTNGHLTVWAWKPGMSQYVRIYDVPKMYTRYDTDLTNAFNAVLLWIYETGRTSGPANQMQWYDQVILSAQPIACPVV